MLEVLDTAGQEEYTALRDQWIRDGEGFVLVYSITSRASFGRIQKFYNQIQLVKESANSGSPTGASYLGAHMSGSLLGSSGPVPVMLVGNKSDKAVERAVSAQEGSALAKELGCEFVEASAKNCINVEKAFYDVVRLLRQQRQQQQYGNRNTEIRRGSGFPNQSNNVTQGGRDGRPQKGNGGRGLKCVVL